MSESKELMLKEQSHVSYIDQNLDLIANQNKCFFLFIEIRFI